MSEATNNKKTVLITGCSSGIGHCTAMGLAKRGYQVIATVRNIQDKDRLNHPNIQTQLMDLQDSSSIQKGLDAILQNGPGHIDVLFNNAGFGQPGALADIPREAMRQQFETNVFGTLELTQAVLRRMHQQGQGRILFNSSVLGFVSLPYRGAYNASKHALEALADTLRLEFHDSGIYVSLIEPGPIRSHFRKTALRAFMQNIDVENSLFRNHYKKVLCRLQTEDQHGKFTLPPEAVLKRVIHAIESPRPKIRYYVTLPTYMFAICKRLLPLFLQDSLLRLVEKYENQKP
ncbi:MAG: SDR family NAD(P)-dependent oxidoreductase [Gammaproteobacteria bacterium]|nr:MAG: SDR family NAD(P)-dependent oxidoreductase [Gammaproteobacteria bacterium]